VPKLDDATPLRSGSGAASRAAARARSTFGGSGRGVAGFLRRLSFGDPAPTPMHHGCSPRAAATDTGAGSLRPGETSVAECLACEPSWEFARRHPDLGVRVYRTAAGLRVLVTGAAARPGSDRARALLAELGSDPLYVELCATHDSYRARLTPKPFRVGSPALAVQWPFADGTARGRYEEWVSQYDARAAGHAVCRLISVSGPEPGPDEQRLVAVHDARCRVGERLPLA